MTTTKKTEKVKCNYNIIDDWFEFVFEKIADNGAVL